EIVFGVLIVVLRRHRVAGGLRVAGELHVFLRHMRRRSANLDVRAVRFVDPRQWIVTLAVTPPHALVLTVSHGSLLPQPLLLRRHHAVNRLHDTSHDTSIRPRPRAARRYPTQLVSHPCWLMAAGFRGARSSKCRLW